MRLVFVFGSAVVELLKGIALLDSPLTFLPFCEGLECHSDGSYCHWPLIESVNFQVPFYLPPSFHQSSFSFILTFCGFIWHFITLMI